MQILDKLKFIKEDNFILLLLIIISTIIGLISVYQMPLFSDSAFHAAHIREIVRTGDFPIYSPIGWVVPDMHPLSFEPFLTHPPLFYLANTAIYIFGIDLTTTLSIIIITSTAMCIPFIYKLTILFFDKKIALLSSILLTFMPMSIWLEAHRIMEPLQYLLSLSAFYYIKKYIDTKDLNNLLLGSVFSCGILYIKITSLFIVVTIVVFLVLSKIPWKYLLIFCLLTTFLYSPYLLFSLRTRGTISYSAPGLPLIDHYIFKPWWNWQLTSDEQALNMKSNREVLFDKLVLFDKSRRAYIQNDAVALRIPEVLQNYNIFAISESANSHWFSPNKSYAGVFFIFFVTGIVIYIEKYRKTNYHYILLPLFIVITIYLTKAAELRYFYILNILSIIFYSLTIKEVSNLFGKNFKAIIFTILATSLCLTTYYELAHSHQYQYSFLHNIMPKGTGIDELQTIDRNLLADPTKNIFTFATSDVGYYLDRRTVADYRLLFIPESDVKKYLDLYNVSLIILPNFYLNSEIYSSILDKKVPNTIENWENTSVPLDSDFYKYLNDSNQVQIIQKSVAFTVYKRIDN